MHKYVLNTMPQDLPTRHTFRDGAINVLIAVSCVAVGAVGWAAWRVGTLADSVKVPDLSATVAKANGTLDVASATFASVNRPCAPGPCGTLAETNKAIVKVGDAIVTTQLQERAIAPATIAAVNSLATVAPHVNPLLDMGTDTLQQARTDLVTADGTIAAAQPVLVNLAATESDLDAAVNENRKEVSATLANVNLLAANTAGVMADVKVETDQMVKPKTKAQRIFSYAPVTLKLAAEVACLTTGTPCP